MSIAIVAAVVVAIAAIVAIGVARPRRDRQGRIDIVFRTRFEAAGVEVHGADRTVAGALIAER